jgi:hypothetical protein
MFSHVDVMCYCVMIHRLGVSHAMAHSHSEGVIHGGETV